MLDKLEGVRRHFEEVTERLSNPATVADQALYRKLSKEHSDLTPLMETYDRYTKVRQELRDQETLVNDPEEDPELKEMAHAEIPGLKETLAQLSEDLKTLLLPKDPLDNNDVILEIRAGAGGDEAALFAGDLLRMYQRHAEESGWRTELLSSSPSEMGGFKEVVIAIEGNQIYGRMKFESGVHRVQRVPATESQGRIHTSTVTVAVLPESEEVEVEINASDLRIDVFRASGPGGQSVNTTDSAVRITHVPTGIVAQSQDEKSQHKNKAKAMKVLSARIYEKIREEQERKEAEQRRSMVGTGDRSERIRTYNYPQGRVTDHRIGLTLHRLPQILEGDIEELTEALMAHERAMLLQHSADSTSASA